MKAPASAGEVRCECDDCGAHLFAHAGANRLYGICYVCGSDRFRPV